MSTLTEHSYLLREPTKQHDLEIGLLKKNKLNGHDVKRLPANAKNSLIKASVWFLAASVSIIAATYICSEVSSNRALSISVMSLGMITSMRFAYGATEYFFQSKLGRGSNE